jgi:long-chain acyl-CoA synthetase
VTAVALPSTAEPERPWLARYPPGVPPHLSIPPKLLTEIFAEVAARVPDHPALRYYGASWTYRRLAKESENLAGAFAEVGVGPGDRVALYLPNGPAYPVALLATLRLGAIAVPVSPLYHGDDLTRVLRDAAPKALVTLEIHYPNVARVRAEAPVPSVFVARLREFYPAIRRPFVNLVLRRRGLPTEMPRGPGVVAYRTAVRTDRSVPLATGDPATTVAVFQYTGGTTGVPKAAMLTHRNLVANVRQTNAWNTTRTPEEVILASIPFFHIYGLTVGLLLALLEGWTVVIQTRPEAAELLRLVRKYRPSQFPGVPALYLAMLQRPDLARYDLRSIRYCLSGSAPLPREVQEQFERVTGGRVIEGYGLTEASPVTHANPVEGERRAGSIGLPIPETEHRIVDPETGVPSSSPEAVGELTVRGPQVMVGYYHAPEETGRTVRDGWLFTGDLARIDADGYAYIVDRKKDMINVGGLKVYPREVEETLFRHPAVLEAAVVGVPDPALGEVPKAFVVLRPGATATAEELIGFVRERVAHYKAPRSVEFRGSLPRSGVQKVLRRELREPPPAPP